MKSRLLKLAAVLHSELITMKSRILLGTMASVRTSAQHSIVRSVAGRINTYAAIFHSTIVTFCRGQSSSGFTGLADLFVSFETFRAVPLTPAYGFTQLRMEDAWLAQRWFSVRKKACSPDCVSRLSGSCLFLLSVKTPMPCVLDFSPDYLISDRKSEAFFCQCFSLRIFVPAFIDIHLLSLIPGTHI